MEEQDQRLAPSQEELHQQMTFGVAHGKQLVSPNIQSVIVRSSTTFDSRTLLVITPHPGVGAQPTSSVATGPSINHSTTFIASHNSLFHCLSFHSPCPDHSSCQDVHLSSSFVPAKCQDPTTNPVCPLGLQTLSQRQPHQSRATDSGTRSW